MTDPFLLGVTLFNAGRYWDAHEAWEELWLPAVDPERQFLQGLIQLTAAYHHISRGTSPRGAVRLLDAALRRLGPFPAGHCGVDRAEAEGIAAEHRGLLSEGKEVLPGSHPKLRLVPG